MCFASERGEWQGMSGVGRKGEKRKRMRGKGEEDEEQRE